MKPGGSPLTKEDFFERHNTEYGIKFKKKEIEAGKKKEALENFENKGYLEGVDDCIIMGLYEGEYF